MLPIAIAAIPLLIWTYLLLGRGGFWRVARHISHTGVRKETNKTVVAIIPARNEAGTIASAITSLLDQDFPSLLGVIAVDDGSEDDTAGIARAAAEARGKTDELTIISGQLLPTGWTGKLWALSQGVRHARTLAPDYLLFTDADIVHGSGSVAQLVSIAESGGYDLTSYMVKLACATTAEKALIPAFVFFFLKLYPPAWIQLRSHATAAAAGGSILIRAAALEDVGGLAAISGEVIDDCALARAVKGRGGRIWLGLTDDSRSTRPYGSFAEIGRMISRSAFNQLQHSNLLLAATLLGLFFTYLLPPVLLFTGRVVPVALGAFAWLLMSLAYLPMVRFYRQSPAWSLLLPLIALFYAGATIHSALQYWMGRGGEWKGRVQDVRVR